jgi:serine/threonine protein kinase
VPTLKHFIADKALDVPEAVALAKLLLDANQFLLSYDLVHGDLKPENILVLKRGDQLAFKLIDFGSITGVCSATSRSASPCLNPSRARFLRRDRALSNAGLPHATATQPPQCAYPAMARSRPAACCCGQTREPLGELLGDEIRVGKSGQCETVLQKRARIARTQSPAPLSHRLMHPRRVTIVLLYLLLVRGK